MTDPNALVLNTLERKPLHVRRRPFLSIAVLTFALLVPAAPGHAGTIPEPTSTASVKKDAPAAEPSGSPTAGSERRGGTVAAEPSVETSTSPSKPTAPTPTSLPTAGANEPAAPSPGPSTSESAGTTLSEEIGELGSYMGQGLERLKETGNAQTPTDRDRALDEAVDELGLKGAELQFGASAPSNAAAASSWRPTGIQGLDVSSHQLTVDWQGAYNQGARFAYVKATEGTGYKNPYFSQQYGGSASAGMIRGAYHFALPSLTSGAAQANYFIDGGGGWTADGQTLPPLLDVEYNPYSSLGNDCYNMSASQMVTWIRDFSNTVLARTGRVPMIYTTTDWWNRCTGASQAFSDHPLHLAAYNQAGPGTMPNGWTTYTVWQYSATGPFVGDSNVWNGTSNQLAAFARNSGIETGQQGATGPNEVHFRGGVPASSSMGLSSDKLLTCDWDGNGVSTPATFYGGVWIIRNSLSSSDPGFRLSYGSGTDQPICGDWDGNGTETIGVYRNGVAYVKNSNSSGFADGVIVFGAKGDTAIVGDWDRDGNDTLGVARPSTSGKQFYLTNSNLRPSVAGSFVFGNATDVPVSGDWDNDGYSTVGVKRGSQWFLANSNLRVVTNVTYAYGDTSDAPITGRWARGRATSVGVVRAR
ncbi:lysozyme [Arthrobacter sedimenti]|uniref:lysozyme n=1 Tax=Arthrobacter sedimenti TaxID=2694931 RepID=UPI000B574441|nr:lysozyme [Arthrobacter sedimenti]OUM39812.1 hypothetical protein B8W73_15310 [Arthrobacter agilis]